MKIIGLTHVGVASGKCGFTTLRILKDKKSLIPQYFSEKLSF